MMNVGQLKEILGSVNDEASVYVSIPGAAEDEGSEVLRVNICVDKNNAAWDVSLIYDPTEK